MKKRNSGKVLTIFLVIIAILLISLTAIFAFFFQKEIERRKEVEQIAENNLQQVQQFEGQFKEAQKQSYLLEEKNKELDERVNSLLDELELEEGIREELKLEVAALKKKTDGEAEAKEKLRKELSQKVLDADQKIADLEAKLKAETNKVVELEKVNKELEKKVADLAKSVKDMKVAAAKSANKPKAAEKAAPSSSNDSPAAAKSSKPAKGKSSVLLEPIVVMPGENIVELPEELKKATEPEQTSAQTDDVVVVPNEIPDGRILSVDKETAFVIINLGEKDGLTNGRVLSVYRGEEFLGDIKVTRVQPEMAAADILPPFSVQMVRKNDQVSIK